MNSKAIKRQLLAAIAMVLVAALALGSSTFAWFANNNVVTANGITVTAQAEGALLVINKTQGSLFTDNKTSETLGLDTGNALYPTHNVYSTTLGDWKHAYSKDFNKAVNGGTEVNISAVDGYTTDDDYYLHSKLYIGLDDTNSSAVLYNLRASQVNISGADNLLGSARVILVVNNNVVGVYTSTGIETTQYGDDGTGGQEKAFAGNTNDPLLKSGALNAGDEVEVEFYVFFDGRDPDCKSANYSDAELTVNFEFTADTTDTTNA